jgi:hypothetical protein
LLLHHQLLVTVFRIKIGVFLKCHTLRFSVKSTNLEQAKKMQPIYVEGMQMHILAKGASFSLKERKMILDKS